MATCDSGCYWYGKCYSQIDCDDYTPIFDDVVSDGVIDEKREEFDK